jgi:polar amino acid transport system substrate-binding protein
MTYFNRLNAAEIEVVKVITESAHPLSYLENNRIKGLATELLKEIMADANLKYDNKLLPWVRAYKTATTQKDTLLYSVGRTIEREDKFRWVGEIIPMGYNLYGLTKNQSGERPQLDVIKEKYIGVPRNDLRHSYLKKQGFKNLIFTNSYEHTYKLLTRGRIDYFIASTWGINAFKKKHNLKNSDVVTVIGFEELKTDLYFAFNIKTSDDLYTTVKSSYEKVRANGSYEKIMRPMYTELQLTFPELSNH